MWTKYTFQKEQWASQNIVLIAITMIEYVSNYVNLISLKISLNFFNLFKKINLCIINFSFVTQSWFFWNNSQTVGPFYNRNNFELYKLVVYTNKFSTCQFILQNKKISLNCFLMTKICFSKSFAVCQPYQFAPSKLWRMVLSKSLKLWKTTSIY